MGICLRLFSYIQLISKQFLILSLVERGRRDRGWTMKRGWMLLVMVAVFLFSGAAKAEPLEIIGTATYSGNVYNLIYEPAQGLVWLDYTKGYAFWGNQVTWAAGLNGAGVLTYNLNPGISVSWAGDWRLPSTNESAMNLYGGYGWQGPDQTGNYNYAYGYNMANSEMGHLYYESLMWTGYVATDGTEQPSGWGFRNTGPLSNLQGDYYWSVTEYSLGLGGAWDFSFGGGNQSAGSKTAHFYALAVRPASVPEPSLMVLLGISVLSLAGLKRWWKE